MTTADDIRDAAEPIAAALVAVQDMRLGVRTTDILISFTKSGCVVRVAGRSGAHRDEIEACFREVFEAAGWGVAVRGYGGLSLDHPVELTRLSHDAGR